MPLPLDVEALYARYGPMVVRRCRQILRDETEAMDVAQDVFVQVMRSRDRLDGRYPSSLLNRIATNLSLNRLRDRQRERLVPAEGLLEAIACAPDLDAPLVLERLFRRHPASTRTMAVLHYLDGMAVETIASECGLSAAAVRKRLQRLRQSLHALEGA